MKPVYKYSLLSFIILSFTMTVFLLLSKKTDNEKQDSNSNELNSNELNSNKSNESNYYNSNSNFNIVHVNHNWPFGYFYKKCSKAKQVIHQSNENSEFSENDDVHGKCENSHPICQSNAQCTNNKNIISGCMAKGLDQYGSITNFGCPAKCCELAEYES